MTFDERAKRVKELICPARCLELLGFQGKRFAAFWRGGDGPNVEAIDHYFKDHVTGEFFDVIDMVNRVLGVGNVGALEWLEGHTGSVCASDLIGKGKPRHKKNVVKRAPLEINDQFDYLHRRVGGYGPKWHKLNVVRHYNFTLAGEPVHREVRCWCPVCHDKTFKQDHFRDGKWWSGLSERPLIPYCVDYWRDHDWVVIAEGCKDAETLLNLILPATSFVCGSGKWRDEYAQWFYRKKVVICLDNDQAGEKQLILIAVLKDVGCRIKTIVPSDRPKGDVTDFIETGGTKNDLMNMIMEALWR